jgi:NMT1 family protein
MKLRKNSWTVGVAGGQLSGTYMTFANELAEVLDDGDNLRVIPIVTYGAASNLDDLLYLRNVDVAVTQADVFEYFRTHRKIANLASRVNYIIRLPVSEMHILARADVTSIEDLRGKKVSFGPAGSASSLTGTIVFQRLGVEVEQALYDNPTALQKLKTGELAALVRVIGKPIDFFAKLPPIRVCTSYRFRFQKPSPTITRSASSRAKNIPAWCRKVSPSTRSLLRRCLRCSIGRKETIATGAWGDSSKGSSPSGQAA